MEQQWFLFFSSLLFLFLFPFPEQNHALNGGKAILTGAFRFSVRLSLSVLALLIATLPSLPQPQPQQ